MFVLHWFYVISLVLLNVGNINYYDGQLRWAWASVAVRAFAE